VRPHADHRGWTTLWPAYSPRVYADRSEDLLISAGLQPGCEKSRWKLCASLSWCRECRILNPSCALPAPHFQPYVVDLMPNVRGAIKHGRRRAGDRGAGVCQRAHSRCNTRKGSFDQVKEVRRSSSGNSRQPGPMVVESVCSTAFGCSMKGRIPSITSALAEAGVNNCTRRHGGLCASRPGAFACSSSVSWQRCASDGSTSTTRSASDLQTPWRA